MRRKKKTKPGLSGLKIEMDGSVVYVKAITDLTHITLYQERFWTFGGQLIMESVFVLSITSSVGKSQHIIIL